MSDLIQDIVNGRILKKNGSWMYCDKCNKTVGYLVYSTYQYFKLDFECKCGNRGFVRLEYKTDKEIKNLNTELLLMKNRLCCPIDKVSLFSIVKKNINNYSYFVTCNKCLNKFEKEMQIMPAHNNVQR